MACLSIPAFGYTVDLLILFRKMAIPQLSSIESLLAQMRAVAQAASASPLSSTSGTSSVSGGGFAVELQRSLQRVSATENAAVAQAKSFEMGTPGISLNNVMIDLQKANIGFQTAIQVRNRLVAAYQEIASMPV
jgi:flagellar hook-basal body complex protein FliE